MFNFPGYGNSSSYYSSESSQMQAALRMSQNSFEKERKRRETLEQQRRELERLQFFQTQAQAKNVVNNRKEHEVRSLTTMLQCVEWQSMFINRGAGVGLRNLGNSCFMNASLQCLAYCPIFAQLLMQANHSKHCNSRQYRKFCTLCELESFIPSMHVSKQTQHPRQLFRNLTNINALLRVGCQEDAHEFIQSLLDKCELAYDAQYQSQFKREILKAKQQHTRLHKHKLQNKLKKSDEVTEEEPIPRFTGGLDPQNPIRQLFVGETKTSVVCKKCHTTNVTPEPFCCLSLEIADADTIDESLTIFSNKELMMGAEKYMCDVCQKRRLATKQIQISQIPVVLMLHLKRFSVEFYADQSKQFTTKKINKNVEFPLEIDFKHDLYLQSSDIIFKGDRHHIFEENQCTKYELCSVLVHSGPKLGYGHYYALVKSPDGQWYKMNDSSVTRIKNIKLLLNEQAYILFYRRMSYAQTFIDFERRLNEVQNGIPSSSMKNNSDAMVNNVQQKIMSLMSTPATTDDDNSNGNSPLSADSSNNNSDGNVGTHVIDSNVTGDYFRTNCKNPSNNGNDDDRTSYVHVPPLATRPELNGNQNQASVHNNNNNSNKNNKNDGGSQFEEIFWPATDI